MESKQLRDLLNRLQDALEQTEDLDPETRALVAELDQDINRLLDPEDPDNETEGIIEAAQSVQTRFAVDHPVADRFLREIIDTLAKVGI